MHHRFYIEPVLKHYTNLTDLLSSDELSVYVQPNITINELLAGQLTVNLPFLPQAFSRESLFKLPWQLA